LNRAGGYRIAIVGATGLVGEALVRVLAERGFPVSTLRAFAGARSAGAKLRAFGDDVVVESLDDAADPFSDIDVAFFAAGEDSSRKHARSACERAVVIDKSAAFRLDPAVPLVVPEANADAVLGARLIASPNCSTIPLAVALAPIQRAFGLGWVSVATYQSVSGAGRDAVEEFEAQIRGGSGARALPRRIAGNVIPEIGGFGGAGDSGEESKIAAELRKILGLPALRVSATTVRVPVAVGHSEAVAFGTARPATLAAVREAFESAPGVKFQRGEAYATPLEATGSDDVFVGRLRADAAHPGGFLCWIVCDNLRKGAATNAIQIAELALAQAPTRA